LWRGCLPPLGREAALYISPDNHIGRFYDCYAVERGQAPLATGLRNSLHIASPGRFDSAPTLRHSARPLIKPILYSAGSASVCRLSSFRVPRGNDD